MAKRASIIDSLKSLKVQSHHISEILAKVCGQKRSIVYHQ